MARANTRKKTSVQSERESSGKRPKDFRNDVQEYKRDLILKVAMDVFYEKGYQNSTVDEIAAKISMSKAVVYWNFNSKLELLEEIVDRATGDIAGCINCIQKSRRPCENLADFCFQHASVVLKNQRSIAIFYFERRNFSEKLKNMMRLRQKKLVDALVEVLVAGVAAGEFEPMDCELVALEIVSMVSMTFDWRWHREAGRYSSKDLSLHLAGRGLRLAGYDGEFPLAEAMLKAASADERLGA